jgi:DDE superfamily endonuclease
MLTMSLPDTLTTLLTVFASCFTQPTFRTFQALVAGFLAQPGPRTVTGMLVGAGLAGRRHHDLAYRFFASARWSADQLGLVLLDLITQTLVPPGAPIVLATDDTLWRRTGRKLYVVLAAMSCYRWTPVRVRCYGKTLDREVLALRCLWYGALGSQPVQAVLSRPVGACDGYELALVTTDLAATPAAVIERYATRWSAEQAFLDARHLVGVGQARTRTKRSVERLVPFGLCCLSVAICW